MARAEGPEPAAVQDLLDHLLVRTVDGLGAHAGALFLPEPGGEILALDVSVGMPPEFIAPLWRQRVTADDRDPVMEAMHQRHLVSIRSSEEAARRNPRNAMIFPYPFAPAVAPLVTGSTVWGATAALFPENGAGLDVHARRRLTTAAQCIAWVLQGAAAAGHRLRPGAEPRFLPLPSPGPAAPAQAQAAVDFLTSVPEGACRLDPRGRITFADPTAASMLGADRPRLLGARLWEVVPWLDHPGFEHRHRAAVASQLPASYPAQHPAGGQLLFQLYPDHTGVSVRITPTGGAQDQAEAGSAGSEAAGSPAQLDALHHQMHLSTALAEAASVRQAVDLVADHVLLALQAQAFALFVAEAGRVRVVGQRGFPPELVQLVDHARLSPDSGVQVPGLTPGAPAWELAHGVPSFFADREEMRAVTPGAAEVEDGMGAWAWLPLMTSGQLVGVWVVGYKQPRPFSLAERTVLTATGALIAQALDRTRQYDATYQLAEGLQARLLPRALPAIPGLEVATRYLPASHGMNVGGDFYDLIRLGDTEAAAVIGDVQGHDVSAAGLMGQVRTAVHAYASSGANPRDILARTNHLLTDLDPRLLTSCLYAHIDLAGHRAHLATAGHFPPLLRHPDQRSEILSLPPGPLLGVDPAAHYPITEVAVPPGTVLALYTDGLIEAPGTDLDTSITKLAAVLSDTAGPLDGLADALLTRAQPAGDRADDAALLLLNIGAQPRQLRRRPTANAAGERRRR